MKPVLILVFTVLLQGCTLLAVADAAGSAVVYGVKTTVNALDAVTPDMKKPAPGRAVSITSHGNPGL